MKRTNKMITSLKENQIFVFGSNLVGKHLGGAARQAKDDFGAEERVGEGITGQSYAFPTLSSDFEKFTPRKFSYILKRLYECCEKNPSKEFLLTKVGCGIAGYSEEFMKSLFTNPPKNLVLPDDWKIQ